MFDHFCQKAVIIIAVNVFLFIYSFSHSFIFRGEANLNPSVTLRSRSAFKTLTRGSRRAHRTAGSLRSHRIEQCVITV